MTVYFGNLMPRRYIGSTSVSQILKGYRGSVASDAWKTIFYSELSNNPHLFKTKILQIFDTREEALLAEYELHIRYNVVKSPDYINMSTSRPNGFFGRDVSGTNNPMYGKSRRGEKHANGKNISDALKKFYETEEGKQLAELARQRKLSEDNPWRGQKHSEETKQKMSETRKGENNGMYGKKHSEETKRKLSEMKKKAYADGTCLPSKTPISEEQKERMRIGRSKESSKQKLRNIYRVNGVIVDNASKYCEENGLNYIRFTQAAKHNLPYGDMVIEIIKQRKYEKKNDKTGS